MTNEEVWAETVDGGLLRQLFGQYPTLHDATIQSVEIDRQANLVTMTLDYLDTVGENPREGLEVQIRLEWRGVRSFDLPLDETDLFGLQFERSGLGIVTHLEIYPGQFGRVESDSVEAVLVQVDSKPADTKPWLRMR